MSHVDEGTLHALVDDALDASERSAVEAHLASCGDCARRFAEATAMARQVVALLGALDAPAPRVKVAPAVLAPAPDVPSLRTATRRHLFTLRRVALAASLFLVAGVSYEVGKNRERPSLEVATPASARMPARAAPLQSVPSVAEIVADSFVATPAPSVRAQPRGGPRSDSPIIVSGQRDSIVSSRGAALGFSVAVASDTAAPRRDATARATGEALERVQADERARKGPPPPSGERRMQVPMPLEAVTVTGMPSSAKVEVGSGAVADVAVPKAIALAGYSVTEDSLRATVTRRRYVSPSGAALELFITPSAAPRRASATQRNASEFLVTTANGRSVVRWQAGGMDYTLEGALAPDSLMTLATRLKP